MIRWKSLAIVIFLSISAGAQNLVVNPGFELFRKGLPVIADNRLASYGVSGWYMPTQGTPDWYCNIDNDSNPIPTGFRNQYFAGKTDPHSGRAFAGFCSYFYTNSQAEPGSEYIGGTLTGDLQAGHTYTISFWIKSAPYSNVYHDSINVFFTANKLEGKGIDSLKYDAQVQLKIDTSQNWILVRTDYTASGDERFFAVGNFNTRFTNSGKAFRKKKNIYNTYAYYYVDDFTITDKSPAGPLSISAGQKLTFNNILFDTGKSSLLASSFSTLDQIVAALKKQPTLKVTINGHTDSDGDSQTNQTLSEQRALSVKKYFISKGIDSTRISTKGFGSSQPIGTDKSRNRRVEFIFAQ